VSEAPDVVVTDIRMPPTGPTEGLDAAAEIRQVADEAGIFFVEVRADEDADTILNRLIDQDMQARSPAPAA